MAGITKQYINEHGEGHWRLTDGKLSLTCDLDELTEALREFEEMKIRAELSDSLASVQTAAI